MALRGKTAMNYAKVADLFINLVLDVNLYNWKGIYRDIQRLYGKYIL